MIKLSPLERIIAKLLVDSAINKSGHYSYSELSGILENNFGEKVNPHYGFSKPLGNISILCNELGLPLLSVRVQYKYDTTGKTAEGFYDIACELKPEYKAMPPRDVRMKELELTRTCADWGRLLDYLDGKAVDLVSEPSLLTIQEQVSIYVADIIARYGIGHVITTQEIKDEINRRYATNPDSIIPSDYCYNRWNVGISENWPTFFEYVGRSEYRVLGVNYHFNGIIFAHPKEGQECAVGYCVDGQRHIGKPPVFPDELPDDSAEYREGKKKTVVVNTFERNPAARQACIDHYGSVCFICGFDFGKVYGTDCEGMIHVHHLKMISEADSEYGIDPINDLRPVCPNCHMVLHSKKEGYTVNEVAAMLKQ